MGVIHNICAIICVQVSILDMTFNPQNTLHMHWEKHSETCLR